jgi:hypothetical protein
MTEQVLPKKPHGDAGRPHSGALDAGNPPRQRRGPGRLAWVLFAVSVLVVAVSGLFVLSGHNSGSDLLLALPLFVVTYSGVGALIASRHPTNAIGWIFLAIGLTAGIEPFSVAYVTHPSLLPGRQWAAWLAEWVIVLGFGFIPFVLLLFPDGTVLTRRWRAAAWFNAMAIAILMFGLAFTPRLIHEEGPAPIENPLGISLLKGTIFSDEGVGWLLFPIALVLATVSYILRFRRSRGILRMQLKWFALAGLIVLVSWLFLMVTWQTALGGAALGAVIVAMLTLPVAVGIAILQHRLYDIDVIINRTLVYGVLTVVLGIAYFLGVTLVGLFLRPVTGQSHLGVAISTLAIAGLFRPARARVQQLIDRRFYRTRYNAQRALDGFTSQLREEIDIDALGKALLGVVTETMQPTHASLWLATAPAPSHPSPTGTTSP